MKPNRHISILFENSTTIYPLSPPHEIGNFGNPFSPSLQLESSNSIKTFLSDNGVNSKAVSFTEDRNSFK